MVDDRTARGPRSARPVHAVVLLLTVFALGLGARMLHDPVVLPPDGAFHAPDPDVHYHLRRIEWTAVHYPHVLDFDPYLNHPAGARVIWPAPFDFALATLVQLTGNSGDRPASERLLARVPPVLGALAACAVAAIGWRRFGATTGAFAGTILAVLPAHVTYSHSGYVDHHVAVSLLSAGMLGAALALVAQPPSREGRVRPVALGLAMGGLVALWPGALLQVAWLQALLTVFVLGTVDRSQASRRAGQLALAHAVAALGVAPLGLFESWQRFGSFTPLVLSNLQPVWFAAGSATFAALAAIWRADRFEARGARVSVALGLGGCGVAVGVLGIPDVRSQLGDVVGWFAETEAFLGYVGEIQPLFATPGAAARTFGWALYATPAAMLVLLLARHADVGTPATRRLLVGWAVGLSVATLLQLRFRNSLAPAFALVWGAALQVALASALRHPSLRSPAARRGLVATAVAGMVVLALPTVGFYRPYVAAWQTARAGGTPLPGPWFHFNRVRHDAFHWLERNTPATAGYLDDGSPAYGVLASWSDGHAVKYVGRRAVVQDNFGDYGGAENFAAAERYFAASDEDEALAIAEGLRARYVVARPGGSGHSQGYVRRAMARRLLDPGDGELAHHRLVHESAPFRLGPAGPAQTLRIFEVGRGIGRAGAPDSDGTSPAEPSPEPEPPVY